MMWFSEDGSANTVALPNPEELFSEGGVSDLRALASASPDLSELLEKVEEAWFVEVDAMTPNLADEQRFVGRTPAIGVFAGRISSLEELEERLTTLDWRWRLEVTEAIWDVAIVDED